MKVRHIIQVAVIPAHTKIVKRNGIEHYYHTPVSIFAVANDGTLWGKDLCHVDVERSGGTEWVQYEDLPQPPIPDEAPTYG